MNNIREFFKDNPSVRDIAYEAKKLLSSSLYFPKTPIYFKYELDSTGKEMAWIIIHAKALSYEEAYTILERFDTHWWIKHLPRTKGKLSISILGCRTREE